MVQTRRERIRDETTAEIKQIARQQLRREGAATLSLRAIAREMGMTAPALYRYFADRDALVTALIVDAYNDLANTMHRADQETRKTDYIGRFQRVASAFRQWAQTHPEDYTLIYGTPIPGYHAPREQTVAPAGRVLETIGRILADAWQAGQLHVPDVYTQLPVGLQQVVDALLPQLPEQNVPAAAVALTMIIWSKWHGLVWGELYGHFPPGLAASGELYQVEVQAILELLRLGQE